MKRTDIYTTAIDAGFMLSTQYGQDTNKLMPVSDGDTLVKFAELLLKSNSVKQLSDEVIERIWLDDIGLENTSYDDIIRFARAILKKASEK